MDTEFREALRSMGDLQSQLDQRIGRLQMYKMVLELALPVASQLPAPFIAALQRLDPHASP